MADKNLVTHIINKNIFTFQPVMQQERFRNVEREELYLQTFRRNIHIGPTCRDVATT